jgi:hypothetical protein
LIIFMQKSRDLSLFVICLLKGTFSWPGGIQEKNLQNSDTM